MTVSEYLYGREIEWRKRGNEAILNCPFCNDTERKFSINLETGGYNCLHVNRCGLKGGFIDFQRRLGDNPIALNGHSQFVGMPFKVYSKPKVTRSPIGTPVTRWLADRGITGHTQALYSISQKDDNTVMFNYIRHGELVNVKYRSITEKKMWQEADCEPVLYGADLVDRDTLVICEGEIDCLSLHEYGIQAVSVPMGAGNHQWIDVEWEWLESFSAIILCLDMDEPGRKANREIAKRLGEWRCKIVSLPLKDANECLMAGVSKMEMVARFDNAEDLKPETLVPANYFADQIKELFAAGTSLFGVATPWEELNDMLKGWRAGEVTIWSGRNGSGKSTILNQVFIDLATKGQKSCIYSGEMPPDRYLRWAVMQHLENDSPEPSNIIESLDWMSGNIWIINILDTIRPDKLLADFEYAARRYGVTNFFIDSLMKVHTSDDSDEYKGQQEFVNRLAAFAQKFSVHIHLVAHPRKTMRDDDEPGKVDVRGSSHITDLAHNVIILFRIDKDEDGEGKKKKKSMADMRMYIKKNREFGIEGIINMRFDPKTKKFYDKPVDSLAEIANKIRGKHD